MRAGAGLAGVDMQVNGLTDGRTATRLIGRSSIPGLAGSAALSQMRRDPPANGPRGRRGAHRLANKVRICGGERRGVNCAMHLSA